MRRKLEWEKISMKTVKLQDHFFDQAQKILDFDLKEMCFGEHEELNLTEYTQPCMVSVCLAIVQELKTWN